MRGMIHVFMKESREMFRDKRVRSAAFFGPILLIVVLMVVLGTVLGQIGKRENQRIHVVRTDAPEIALLKAAKVQVVDVATEAEAEKLVRDGKARLALVFRPESPDGQRRVDALVDPKNQTGQITLGAVQSIFGAVNRERLKATLAEKGIPTSAAEPIRVQKKEIQVGEKGGASEFIVGMLPYFIVIWAFYGGMSIATDLVAGEKEKNTLETLLITPVSRTQIVLGKFLALSLVSFLSSLSSLIGLFVVATVKPPGTELLFKGGFGLTFSSALVILLVMLPLVAFFSSCLIAASSYARNPREAQTYLSQVSFVVIMPAVFSQFIGMLDAGSAFWVNAVPILNSANIIRLALLGKFDPAGIAVAVLVNMVLAAIALRITISMFQRESVLARI